MFICLSCRNFACLEKVVKYYRQSENSHKFVFQFVQFFRIIGMMLTDHDSLKALDKVGWKFIPLLCTRIPMHQINVCILFKQHQCIKSIFAFSSNSIDASNQCLDSLQTTPMHKLNVWILFKQHQCIKSMFGFYSNNTDASNQMI